jgi:hypothetical protein
MTAGWLLASWLVSFVLALASLVYALVLANLEDSYMTDGAPRLDA